MSAVLVYCKWTLNQDDDDDDDDDDVYAYCFICYVQKRNVVLKNILPVLY